jgi:hypothetical protein
MRATATTCLMFFMIVYNVSFKDISMSYLYVYNINKIYYNQGECNVSAIANSLTLPPLYRMDLNNNLQRWQLQHNKSPEHIFTTMLSQDSRFFRKEFMKTKLFTQL